MVLAVGFFIEKLLDTLPLAMEIVPKSKKVSPAASRLLEFAWLFNGFEEAELPGRLMTINPAIITTRPIKTAATVRLVFL